MVLDPTRVIFHWGGRVMSRGGNWYEGKTGETCRISGAKMLGEMNIHVSAMAQLDF